MYHEVKTIYNGWTENTVATERRWQRIKAEHERILAKEFGEAKTAFELELERYYSECTCEPFSDLCDSCKEANKRRFVDEIPY